MLAQMWPTLPAALGQVWSTSVEIGQFRPNLDRNSLNSAMCTMDSRGCSPPMPADTCGFRLRYRRCSPQYPQQSLYLSEEHRGGEASNPQPRSQPCCSPWSACTRQDELRRERMHVVARPIRADQMGMGPSRLDFSSARISLFSLMEDPLRTSSLPGRSLSKIGVGGHTRTAAHGMQELVLDGILMSWTTRRTRCQSGCSWRRLRGLCRWERPTWRRC